MARWPRGEAEIERLLGLGHLQAMTGAAADGQPLLAKAGRTLATAASIAVSDPDSALVLAYDAARYAATALLAQQRLTANVGRGPRRGRFGYSCPVRRRLPRVRLSPPTSQRARVPQRQHGRFRCRRGERGRR